MPVAVNKLVTEAITAKPNAEFSHFAFIDFARDASPVAPGVHRVERARGYGCVLIVNERACLFRHEEALQTQTGETSMDVQRSTRKNPDSISLYGDSKASLRGFYTLGKSSVLKSYADTAYRFNWRMKADPVQVV